VIARGTAARHPDAGLSATQEIINARIERFMIDGGAMVEPSRSGR
jgi:hypothetical protein